MTSNPAKCCARKILRTRKKFAYTKKFYLHEIAAADLLKLYFLKNAMKTCKPNNRDLNRDWIIVNPDKFQIILFDKRGFDNANIEVKIRNKKIKSTWS